MGNSASKRNESGRVATRRALLVGCNYPNTKAELAGCVNDSESWFELLTNFFGFEVENVTILVDAGNNSRRLPTGKNIKEALKEIVDVSKPGDIVFFQFSGHGVQVPADEDGDYEADGLDEALCPTDMNLIIDDDLRDILSTMHDDVKFTMVSDCCHSGGMLDHEEIVISGSAGAADQRRAGTKDRGISAEDLEDMQDLQGSPQRKKRELDFQTVADLLGEKSGQASDTIAAHARSTLFKVYGDDASNAAVSIKERNLASENPRRIQYTGPGRQPNNQIDLNKGILITGCQSHETSADVTAVDGRSFGALSHTIVKTVRRHKSKHGDRPITNRALVLKIRQLLNKSGFEQNPCLECSEKNASSNFILW